jgi:hypothetical protein
MTITLNEGFQYPIGSDGSLTATESDGDRPD